MKLVFVIKAIGNKGGGAERVFCQVASGLAMRGHDVLVLSSDSEEATPYYPLEKSIRRRAIPVGDVAGRSSFIDVVRRISSWRRLIRAEKPDVVIGFMHSTYIPLGLALLGTGIPLVASEHIGPEHYASRAAERFLLRLTPFVASRITAVSSQIKNAFPAWMRKKMVVIPNPVVIEAERSPRDRRSQRKIVLSVGRLNEQKDHKTLISAFAICIKQCPDWVLRIIGEGALRNELEQMVEGLGLSSHVEMPGATSEIHSEYRAADLFVMPSLYESFGLATAEALLHGLPAVGFSDCAGTNELIVDGVNGRLVVGNDRVASLAEVLGALMADPEARATVARSPRSDIADRFGLPGILDEWERVLAASTAVSNQSTAGG